MEKLKYRLVTYRGENKIEIAGLGLTDERGHLEKLAKALNKRFPNRNYTVETIKQIEREKNLELVK